MNSFLDECVNYQIVVAFIPVTDCDNSGLVKAESEI
jgi:hypothetical protein